MPKMKPNILIYRLSQSLRIIRNPFERRGAGLVCQPGNYQWKNPSSTNKYMLAQSVLQPWRVCRAAPLLGAEPLLVPEAMLALLGRKADTGMRRWNILQRWFFYIILNLLSIKFYKHILDHPKVVVINPEVYPVLYVITFKCSFIAIYFRLLNTATWSVFAKYTCCLKCTWNLKVLLLPYSPRHKLLFFMNSTVRWRNLSKTEKKEWLIKEPET